MNRRGRIVLGNHGVDGGQVRRSRVAGGRISCRKNGKGDVTGRGWHAVVPRERPREMERQRTPIARPCPGPRCIGNRRQRAVVAHQGHEQDESLHLSREWMDRDERVRGLEVGSRGIDHDVSRPIRGATRDGC